MCLAVAPGLVPLSCDEPLAPPDAVQQNLMISDAGRVLQKIGGATLGTGLLVA